MYTIYFINNNKFEIENPNTSEANIIVTNAQLITFAQQNPKAKFNLENHPTQSGLVVNAKQLIAMRTNA